MRISLPLDAGDGRPAGGGSGHGADDTEGVPTFEIKKWAGAFPVFMGMLGASAHNAHFSEKVEHVEQPPGKADGRGKRRVPLLACESGTDGSLRCFETSPDTLSRKNGVSEVFPFYRGGRAIRDFLTHLENLKCVGVFPVTMGVYDQPTH